MESIQYSMLEQQKDLNETRGEFPTNDYQTHNNVDYGINLFLVISAWLLLSTALVEYTMLILAGLLQLLLGFYQLISALTGAFRKNIKKRNYFWGAIAYLLFLLALSFIKENTLRADWEQIYWTGTLFILPLIGASYYTHLCHQAKHQLS